MEPVRTSAADAILGDGSAARPALTVFARPGCPFCLLLLRRIRRAGLPFEQVDIWKDPAAAAYVRSVADGDETVPTVRIGDLALVNPSIAQVVTAWERVTGGSEA